MRVLHRRIISWIRPWTRRLPHATGGLPGCSPRANAQRHCGSRYFYLVDLSNAYGSVRLPALVDLLVSIGDPTDRGVLTDFLTRYCCTFRGGLLTGLPASPDLFNLYVGSLVDPDLARHCDSCQITYTRYIDDLTFSSKLPIGKRKRAKIRRLIEIAGLQVNHWKCQVVDLRRCGRVIINGVGLTDAGRLYLPRRILTKLRGMIHACRAGKISFSQVTGWMELFWHTTVGSSYRELRSLNCTERRVAIAYDNLWFQIRGPKP